MQTAQLDIRYNKLDRFLSIIKDLKNTIVKNNKTQNDILDIESIEKDSIDYIDLQNTKAQNNKKYNLSEAKEILDI